MAQEIMKLPVHSALTSPSLTAIARRLCVPAGKAIGPVGMKIGGNKGKGITLGHTGIQQSFGKPEVFARAGRGGFGKQVCLRYTFDQQIAFHRHRFGDILIRPLPARKYNKRIGVAQPAAVCRIQTACQQQRYPFAPYTGAQYQYSIFAGSIGRGTAEREQKKTKLWIRTSITN